MKSIKTNSLKNFFLLSMIAGVSILCSCENKSEEATPTGQYKEGVFIVNEGPFGSGTGTVSHYNRGTRVLTNDIFQRVNLFPLGNIVQSVNIFNEKGYIVVNNANKIEVVEDGTFKILGTITGVTQPRNILQINNDKAYVTEWGESGNGTVKVISTAFNAVVKIINIGRKGPEKLYKKGNYVYVTCKGGLGNDSMVTVINSTTDVVVKNIDAGPNPDGIVEDQSGKLWVLCTGQWKNDYSSLEKPGRLVKINTNSNTVETSYSFSSIYSQPAGLTINKGKTKLYYNYDGKICTQDIYHPSLQTNAIVNRSFYSLAIDPVTNIIYAGDAGNFSSNGKVIRYNASGNKLDSLNVGIIPGSFFFK